jgi:hypothetical protein
MRSPFPMSSLNAALLVIGLLVLFGGPALWWVFTRMDNPDPGPAGEPLATNPLVIDEVVRIEQQLGVPLPDSYRRFLTSPREKDIDGQSLFGDADLIVSATLDYRNGADGLPPWPRNFVYIGDEADACPYAIDTASGEVTQTDKGNLQRKPLGRFVNFEEFLASFPE